MVNRQIGVFNFFDKLEFMNVREDISIKPLGIVGDSLFVELEKKLTYTDKKECSKRKYKLFKNRSKFFIKIKDSNSIVQVIDVTQVMKDFHEFISMIIPRYEDVIVCTCGETITHNYKDSISVSATLVSKKKGNPYDLVEATSERTGELANGYDEYVCEKCGKVYSYDEVSRLKTIKYYADIK